MISKAYVKPSDKEHGNRRLQKTWHWSFRQRETCSKKMEKNKKQSDL